MTGVPKPSLEAYLALLHYHEIPGYVEIDRISKSDLSFYDTRSILDSLAAICVSEAQHQSFAVSVSISQVESVQKVTLFVAQNGKDADVPQITIDHLKNLWRILKKFRPSIDPVVSPNRNTPPGTGDAHFYKAVDEVHRAILSYSWPKVHRRLTKHAARFVEETGKLAPEDDSKRVAVLQKAVEALKLIQPIFNRESNPNEKEIRTLASTMTSISRRSTPHLSRFGILEPYRKSCFKKYLTKITSFRQDSKNICQKMFYGRFRSLLDGELVVVPVRALMCSSVSISPAEASVIARDTKLEWLGSSKKAERALQIILGHLKDRAEKSETPLDSDHQNTLLTIPLRSTHAHPECTLLTYHHQNPMLLPFNYIATSEQPCRTCNIYFRFYNALVCKRTKGNEGLLPLKIKCGSRRYDARWNFPSLSPTVDDAIRDSMINESLKPDFQRYLEREVFQKIVMEQMDESIRRLGDLVLQGKGQPKIQSS